MDIIDPVRDSLVVPQLVVDPETGDDEITDASATVMFVLPAEIEENGQVDRYIYELTQLRFLVWFLFHCFFAMWCLLRLYTI